ncbi:MAG: hypothetical protein HY262_05300 [Chloroflexi bacterium]|nr:hypothetical protein [Chloroflexota bacterium]
MSIILAAAAIAAMGLIVLWPRSASAHCDTEDGPAVAAGRLALETGDPSPALAWVHAEGDAEVREVFALAQRVRALGGEARLVADRLFLETLVRVHRVGEGAGFDGIKPAGRVDPVVVAADRAIESGKLEPLAGLVSPERLPELRARLARALALKDRDVEDVEAGRRWVAAYVSFVKYAEGEEHEHGDASHGPHEAAPEHHRVAHGHPAGALVLAGPER